MARTVNNENVNINEETKLERANRIAVQAIGTGYQADFYRTHKKIATLLSEETGWEADESMNKSAQREDFRRFAIEHAVEIGIDWNPTDLRPSELKRVAKYENDEMLKADARDMLYGDFMELIAKCPHGVSFMSLEAEWITPVTHSAKGTDLTKLGVIEGKYERSGNWAWADVEMFLTLTKDGEFVYYTTKCQLVSGQLKKPHITQTSFNEAIKESLKDAGIWVEETKEETKAEKSAEVDSTVEPTEEVKEEEVQPKTTKKRTSKKSK